ncbi:hypothetical protein AF72_00845 [Xylella taiwanensis]|uniref:Uncharacterized protein n=1 Tax=Xylella taiwanensis TaxID=1444770 RepID=Z9JMP7_9GAMM|nr:hypothetical protein AF72_00845 [Xylella taiwanensis]
MSAGGLIGITTGISSRVSVAVIDMKVLSVDGAALFGG